MESINAIIALFGISLGSGPIGSFILWKRLSYFGDTIAHSALLGVTCAMMLGTHHIVGILLISLLPSITLLTLKKCYTKDMLLNIISNSTMALGLIILSISQFSDAHITSMLFGDILAIDKKDIILIYTATIIAALIITVRWNKWLLFTISKELATVARLNTLILEAEFILLLSLLIAIAINIIGILLITSLLIIPAASARTLIHTPVQMVVLSSVICLLSSISGVFISFHFDIPTGPSIIIMSTAIFISANLYSYIHNCRSVKHR